MKDIHLNDLLGPALEKLGATRVPHYFDGTKESGNHRAYTLQTTVGLLEIWITNRQRQKPRSRKWWGSSIHTRFNAPYLARRVYGDDISRTGKWNHYAGEANERGCRLLAELFIAELELMLRTEPTDLDRDYAAQLERESAAWFAPSA